MKRLSLLVALLLAAVTATFDSRSLLGSRTERRALPGSRGVLGAGGLNVENNPGHGLVADIESIVDLPPLGA